MGGKSELKGAKKGKPQNGDTPPTERVSDQLWRMVEEGIIPLSTAVGKLTGLNYRPDALGGAALLALYDLDERAIDLVIGLVEENDITLKDQATWVVTQYYAALEAEIKLVAKDEDAMEESLNVLRDEKDHILKEIKSREGGKLSKESKARIRKIWTTSASRFYMVSAFKGVGALKMGYREIPNPDPNGVRAGYAGLTPLTAGFLTKFFFKELPEHLTKNGRVVKALKKRQSDGVYKFMMYYRSLVYLMGLPSGRNIMVFNAGYIYHRMEHLYQHAAPNADAVKVWLNDVWDEVNKLPSDANARNQMSEGLKSSLTSALSRFYKYGESTAKALVSGVQNPLQSFSDAVEYRKPLFAEAFLFSVLAWRNIPTGEQFKDALSIISDKAFGADITEKNNAAIDSMLDSFWNFFPTEHSLFENPTLLSKDDILNIVDAIYSHDTAETMLNIFQQKDRLFRGVRWKLYFNWPHEQEASEVSAALAEKIKGLTPNI